MKRILLLICLVISTMGIMAQEQQRGGKDNNRSRFNPQEYIAKQEAYITERAGFSKEEADKFFPLFHEMKGKQRYLNHQAGQLKHPWGPNKQEIKDYSKAISQITQYEIQSAKVGDTYYKKMCKVVSAQKVYKAMQADDAFNREMLERFNRGGGPRNPNNNNKQGK